MSIDNSEIDSIPCRQGFIGISTIHADILVLEDFNTDLLKPHSSQEECGFSKLILKSTITLLGLTYQHGV